MTILCIILAAYCCIHNNVILLTAPGSFTGLFVKVSRHLTALIGFLRRFNGLMVVYTLTGVKGLKMACRGLKTCIKSTTAPRQGNQARHPEKQITPPPAPIAAGPDHLQPVRGYAVNIWSRPGSAPVRAN